jgi:hypothetical protein
VHSDDARPAVHLSGNGVWFDSRAWIVTARRHGTDLMD